MAKKIYLHAGHFKTATSSLQKILADNRGDLQKVGIDYPLTGQKFPLQHGEMLLDYARERSNKNFLACYLKAFRASSVHTLILSAEAVSNLTAREMSRLLGLLKQYGQLRVVYMIRPWSSYLPSRYQQNIKVCDAWSWWEFLEACKKNFDHFTDINYALNIKAIVFSEPVAFRLLYYQAETALDDLLMALGVGHLIGEKRLTLNLGMPATLIETTRLLNEFLLLAQNSGRSLRFDTLLRNVDLGIAPLQSMGRAQRLLADNLWGGEFFNLLASKQEVPAPISPEIVEQWFDQLRITTTRFGLAEPPENWLQCDLPEHHRPSRLVLEGLPRALRKKVSEM